jgi:hypothetical protein
MISSLERAARPWNEACNWEGAKDKTNMKLPSKASFPGLAAILIAGALLSTQAQAVPVAGNITFKGGATLDTGNIATANQVTAWSNVSVESRDGSYTGFVAVNQAVTMGTPWIFDPGGPKAGLWSVGGFVFNLTSSTIVVQTADFLSISGVGSVSGNGFDLTTANWNFSSQSPGAGQPPVFSFSAATGAPPGGPGTGVPDGGETAALLGVSLLALGFVRRMFLSA